jgi:hypothetical protein
MLGTPHNNVRGGYGVEWTLVLFDRLSLVGSFFGFWEIR